MPPLLPDDQDGKYEACHRKDQVLLESTCSQSKVRDKDNWHPVYLIRPECHNHQLDMYKYAFVHDLDPRNPDSSYL